MANASMRQLGQFGLEAGYGTAQIATAKRFTSFGVGYDANMGVATATPRGQTAATQGWISTESSAFTLDGGVLSYDEVNYLLESVCKKAGAPLVVGTTGKQRVYTIDQFAADSFASYTAQAGFFGSPSRVYQATGVTANEWGFEVSSTDDQIGMTGSLIGKKLAIASTLATTVTSSNYVVAIPSQFTLGYATSYANLNTSLTPVSNAFTVGFNISDRRSLVSYVGNVEPSDVVETVPGLTFSLTLADEVAPVDTFLTNARTGTKQYFRLKGLGPAIPGGAAINTFQLDICCVLADSPSIDDTDGVQSVTFPYVAAYDAGGSNKIFEITTINSLADPIGP